MTIWRYAALVQLAVIVNQGYAQDYPVKPIRIVTSGAGGGSDFAARLIAQGLSVQFNQQVIVDNRAGGVLIEAEVLIKAAPDGYTLLLEGSPVWLLPFLHNNVPYDPIRDFAPITAAFTSPNLLVVHPSLPAKSLRELISLAKARPGELNYGSSTTGGSIHLAAELFNNMAGIKTVRIAYKGTAPAVSALIGGELQLMFPNAPAATPHVRSARLRALAVTSPQPSALAPGTPTMAASGLPGYECLAIFGVFAPAKTPERIVARLNQETVRILNSADVKEKMFASGAETGGGTPQEFGATLKAEMARWGRVIREAGIKAE